MTPNPSINSGRFTLTTLTTMVDHVLNRNILSVTFQKFISYLRYSVTEYLFINKSYDFLIGRRNHDLEWETVVGLKKMRPINHRVDTANYKYFPYLEPKNLIVNGQWMIIADSIGISDMIFSFAADQPLHRLRLIASSWSHHDFSLTYWASP